jgi:HD-like signal output (HDOD) protein
MITVRCPACNQAHDFIRTSRWNAEVLACSACMTPYILRTYGTHAAESESMRDGGNVRKDNQSDAFATLLLRNTRVVMRNLPVFPIVPQRVLGIVNDPTKSMADVSAIINQDPALAIKVLRMANSASFGGAHELKTVQQACARLGAKRVGNLMTTIAAQGAFHCSNARWKGLVVAHWTHACATGAFAQKMASRVEENLREALFLAGLLHGIGKVVLLNLLDSRAIPGAEDVRNDAATLNAVLERFHALVGLHVAMHWGLPAEIRCSIFCQHELENVPEATMKNFTSAVALSELLARKNGYAPDDREMSDRIGESAGYLGIDETHMTEIEEELKTELPATISAMAIV